MTTANGQEVDMAEQSWLKRKRQERKLLRRLNRQLRKDEKVIKRTRGRGAKSDLGDFYCLDLRTNTIEAHHLDLADWEMAVGSGGAR